MNKQRLVIIAVFFIEMILSCPEIAFSHVIISQVSHKNNEDNASMIIYHEGFNLQQVIDTVTPHSTIICSLNQQLEISTPIVISKPLTLKGLNARLPDHLGRQPIIQVESESVAITDFKLQGNASTVPQTERTALIQIFAGNFRIERGLFENSSKDGVEIGGRDSLSTIVGGIVRDIIGRGCVRDVVSLSGPSGPTPHLQNVLVENIRGYNSSKRGTVEVSDGCANVTVRKIYAENCLYAVDVQDHGKQEINRDILLDDIYALHCYRGIRTANHPQGHLNLTITNLTAVECQNTLQVSNTKNVKIENVCIKGYHGDGAAMSVKNCNGLTLHDITFLDCTSREDGLLIENCTDVTIDRVNILNSNSLSSGITFCISTNKVFRNLIVSHVCARDMHNAGIVLEKKNKDATLTDYIISNNIATVTDHIQGVNGLLINNIK